MSNKRIAAALGISPATVKWNLQNIFLKLGVNTRYDVITWLRQERPT
jgi:LuxR family maltose regulon positive regulatory protein